MRAEATRKRSDFSLQSRRGLGKDYWGSASIHRTMPDERCSSTVIRHPARRIFSMVRRLILAPIIRTTRGLKRSKTRPRKGLSGRICSRRISLPPGLQTRRSSMSPPTGSGTEQKTKVAKIESKHWSGKARCWISISKRDTSECKVAALFRALLSIRGLKSTAMIRLPLG